MISLTNHADKQLACPPRSRFHLFLHASSSSDYSDPAIRLSGLCPPRA